MKFYDLNKRLSFVLMPLSAVSLGLFIALIILIILNNQSINITSNTLFTNSYNACESTFTNTNFGGIYYPVKASTPQTIQPYGTLLLQNHFYYQLISVFLLFISGAVLFVVLILSFFLLLKSRVPYQNKCYLFNLKALKISIFVLSWFGVLGIGMYFGYTLTFMLNLGASGCTSNDLKQYAKGYSNNVIISRVMVLMTLASFFVSIGIRNNPEDVQNQLLKVDEQSKLLIYPLKSNVEEQKRIAAQQLQNIPKINKPMEIQMMDQQPNGFESIYASEDNVESQEPIGIEYLNQMVFNPFTSKVPSRFTRPLEQEQIYKPLINLEYNPYQQKYSNIDQLNFNNRNSHIEFNEDIEKLDTGSNILGSCYVSPKRKPISYSGFGADINSPSRSSIKKQNSKVFGRGVEGSKQKTVIDGLRNRYK